MPFCATSLRIRAVSFIAPLLLLLSVIAAHGQTPVTSCDTAITQPGQYFLANDLLNCEHYGVRIVNPGPGDVVLDLNHHQITGRQPRDIVPHDSISIRLDNQYYFVLRVDVPGTVKAGAANHLVGKALRLSRRQPLENRFHRLQRLPVTPRVIRKVSLQAMIVCSTKTSPAMYF